MPSALRTRLSTALVGVVLSLTLLLVMFSPSAKASATLVQSLNSVSNSGTLSASFSTAATANDLLVVVCAGYSTVTITGPTGFTTAKNESGTPSQGIFYKIAAGGETNETCTFSTSMRTSIEMFEYSGILTTSPLDAVNATSSKGSGTSVSSGSVTTTNANDLLLASITTDASVTVSAWSGSFTQEQFGTNSGPTKSAASFAAADRSVSTTGAYSTAATTSSTGSWIGQIAAFKLAPPAVLSVDIVDGSGNSVASPSVALSAAARSFTCQTVTGMLGTSTQKIRITNTTTNPAWTVSIAATNGSTALWSSGSAFYDYNDPTGSPVGCVAGADSDTYAGLLSFSFSSATITPQSGCTTTGVSLGSSAYFNEGVTNAITITSGSTSAPLYCYWDVQGISLSQTIPATQPAGTYSLGLTLTVVAN